MSGSVARLPEPSDNGGTGLPPADVYKTAVEEYRFQATYNWSRTQYLLGFNVAILAAAVAVATRPHSEAVALIFALGLLAASLSAGVVRTQHGYYRAARDHLRRVEDRLNIDTWQRLDTTSTMGDRARKVSVNQFVYVLLAAVAVANFIGGIGVLVRP